MLRVLFAALLAGCLAGCDKPAPDPDPLETVRALLVLHDLEGKQPEQRTDAERKKGIDRAKLAELVGDLDDFDVFIADLYTGFVAGGAARAQENLSVRKVAGHAEVRAGKLDIVLERRGERWVIDLGRTIPPEIKKRAAEEHERFTQARARGQALVDKALGPGSNNPPPPPTD